MHGWIDRWIYRWNEIDASVHWSMITLMLVVVVKITWVHVRGRNLATELSLWLGQSCGTVCQRQFITRTVYTLLNADSNRTFLAYVLVIDSVMPFRSNFMHVGHSTPFCYFYNVYTQVSVSELTSAGVSVLSVSATDNDSGDNGRLTYDMLPLDAFNISDTTGNTLQVIHYR